MATIAFLGTGLLGSALAEAAAGRGDDVTVWNRTSSKAEALAQFGIKSAPTPADAVRGVDRVHLVLRDDETVEEVLAAARSGLSPNTIICDHTTTQPKLTAERSVRLNASGMKYLHCPVFIGPAAARQGLGIIMAAGPKSHFDVVQASLAGMAQRLEYFGERPDLAAVYKLFGNAFIIGIAGTMADVLTLAKSAEVTPDDALKLLDFFNPANTVSGRGRQMAKGDFTPSFELVMARKDVRLMMETAGTLPLAVLPGIAARMDALIASGEGMKDASVLARDAVSR
jgi:3-hydroxyisobutyrate dehydrogenase